MFLIRLLSAKMDCNFIVQNSLLIPPTFLIITEQIRASQLMSMKVKYFSLINCGGDFTIFLFEYELHYKWIYNSVVELLFDICYIPRTMKNKF